MSLELRLTEFSVFMKTKLLVVGDASLWGSNVPEIDLEDDEVHQVNMLHPS